MAIVLRRREDIEKDHLSETCLAAENASALGAEERQNRENRAAFAILAMFGTIINRTHFPMLWWLTYQTFLDNPIWKISLLFTFRSAIKYVLITEYTFRWDLLAFEWHARQLRINTLTENLFWKSTLAVGAQNPNMLVGQTPMCQGGKPSCETLRTCKC